MIVSRCLHKDLEQELHDYHVMGGVRWGNLHLVMWDYYAAIETEPFEDLSLCVRDEAGVLLGFVPVNSVGGKLSYFGQAARIHVVVGAVEEDVTHELLQALRALLEEQGLSELKVVDFGKGGLILEDWQTGLLNAGAVERTRYSGIVDLDPDNSEFRPKLRKSYKSLVNFGRRELATDIMTADNADRDIFAEFQAFHLKVAGRKTRSDESWQAMFDLIASGQAELIIGRYEEAMVACTYVFFDEEMSLYGTGVYERDLFSKPLSHWPVFLAIQRASQRGNRFFHLGDVFMPGETDPKVRNIAFFKKGFASRIIAGKEWSLQSDISKA